MLGLLGNFNHKGGTSPIFFQLWGIPFVVIGQYIIWGRFLFDAWSKGRTFYGVTNRRVVVVQNLWNRRFAAAYINTLPTIYKETGSSSIGTLRFNARLPVFGRNSRAGSWESSIVDGIPVFRDIDNIGEVFSLVAGIREKKTT